jgi:hypothetical protein
MAFLSLRGLVKRRKINFNKIQSVQVYRPRPGDVVVFTVSDDFDDGFFGLQDLQEITQKAFGDSITTFVTTDAMKMEVVRPS